MKNWTGNKVNLTLKKLGIARARIALIYFRRSVIPKYNNYIFLNSHEVGAALGLMPGFQGESEGAQAVLG